MDLFFRLGSDGVKIHITKRRKSPDHEKWGFHLSRVKRAGRRPIHVYHYACRFKREVAQFRYERGEAQYEVQERTIWETLHERRSGSILSKMIRKGEVHARKIQDIIGAMFIVKNEREVESLQEALFDIFGGPLRWKDRVNTIKYPEQRTKLNVHSGRGYEVLKSDVDVLYAPPGNGKKSYIFSVEIQIYPIEAYLRTLYDAEAASHDAYKRRQFLHDLLPLLFPAEIYGPHPVLESFTELPPTPAS